MKVLIISGNHPRHRYILEPIKKHFVNISCIMMLRESSKKGLPTDIINNNEKNLLKKHFEMRYLKETKYFGKRNIKNYFVNKNFLKIKPSELNSIKMKTFLKKKYDICFVMGAGLFKKSLLKLLPKTTINIHLGLSPWYRGSATLFWPSYNMEPWKTGVTFHKIDENIDSGSILHQSIPKIKKNMGVIDLSISAIIKAREDFDKILLKIKKKKKLKFFDQKFHGKTYFSKSFRACHLKVIYELYNDKIVNYFYKKKKKIKIIKFV